ncbi:MAG: amino acid racemase [Myxococcales bacterium]|nr:amino acid racemase [Myxococcales bacterium]
MKAANGPVIGVLGGMGPVATATFFDLLLRAAQRAWGAAHDGDYPGCLIDARALPAGIDETGLTDETAAGAILVERAKALIACGATLIVIPCNAAHAVAPAIEAQTGVPVLHMLRTVGQRLVADGFTRAGVLCCAYTRASGLYERTFAPLGLAVEATTDDEQRAIDEAIFRVMGGDKAVLAAPAFQAVLAAVGTRAKGPVVLGCTELAEAPVPSAAVKPYDSLALLAQAVIEKFLPV